MPGNATPSYCAELVRRLDYDRFLCALFAPASRREPLFAVSAFNAELARIREHVTEPMLRQIRLQWWRDRVADIYAGAEPAARGGEVLAALSDAIRSHALSREPIERLMDAREFDLSDAIPEDLESLVRHAEASAGNLALLALEILVPPELPDRAATDEGGEEARQAARHVGVAWGLLGLLRSVPFHARAARVFLPKILLEREGARVTDVIEGRRSPGLAAVAGEVAAAASARLEDARALRGIVPDWARPALLPGILADAYLRRLRRAGYDVFDSGLVPSRPARQLRLLAAALTRRY
ncbi:MAG: phytoene/squalene synthase family protein [Alphaproteobacteria bacterium]